MKFSFIFLVLGLHLWLVGCGDKPRPEKKLTLTPTRPKPILVVKNILQPDEWKKPEASINLPTERLEAELKHSLQDIHALKWDERPDQSCFFKGLTWKGDDTELRAEGETHADTCVVKTPDGKELIYHNNKVEVSVAIRCMEGGLTAKIKPNTSVVDFDPHAPFCVSGEGEIFYQSRMTGEIAYPLGDDTMTITYRATSARMSRGEGSCHAVRDQEGVQIQDNCMDVNLLKTHYADKTNWMYRSFTYRSVGSNLPSGKLNRGHFETELNDWVGTVALTDTGVDYELKKGEEMQKGHME